MNVHGVLCDLGRIPHMLRACISYFTDPFATGRGSESLLFFRLMGRHDEGSHCCIYIAGMVKFTICSY